MEPELQREENDGISSLGTSLASREVAVVFTTGSGHVVFKVLPDNTPENQGTVALTLKYLDFSQQPCQRPGISEPPVYFRRDARGSAGFQESTLLNLGKWSWH